jgi:GTP cyclohydrolase II
MVNLTDGRIAEKPNGGCRMRNPITILIGHNRAAAEFIGFDGLEGGEHIAIRFPGRLSDLSQPTLVRVHSECLTGDLFGSARCDCGQQLDEAIERLTEEGGVLLYLRQEGRGIGLYAKLEAYRLQERGLDTYAANRQLNLPEDARDFSLAAQMLLALKLNRIRLLTNNPDKVDQLRAAGIDIVEIRRTGVFVTDSNRAYLQAKLERRHMLDPSLLSVSAPGRLYAATEAPFTKVGPYG